MVGKHGGVAAATTLLAKWRSRPLLSDAIHLIPFSLPCSERFLSWISNPDVSLVPHWTGLGLGIVWGLLQCEWIKYSQAQSVSMGMQHENC
jgi:sulfite exporter TauE/SafE